jgi:hypothetical protein
MDRIEELEARVDLVEARLEALLRQLLPPGFVPGLNFRGDDARTFSHEEGAANR